MNSKSTVLAGVAALAVTVSCAVPANAAPGRYTVGGNVAVVLSTGGCAAITWPKGYTHIECGTTTVIQGPITPGDRFGASVVSYSGWAVSCRLVDVTTGDLIWSDYATGGLTADCVRTANR